MKGGEGMVAVVRGLRDVGLAVTLLDGNREYTLMPNSMLHTSPPQHKNVATFHGQKQQSTQYNSTATEAGKDINTSRDMGAQVTDGRYASIYKTAHCHVKPSSPPFELTEFPPQRAELCRGHGNFEVGGAGSRENYVPAKLNGQFRGGMSWPDRGAVYSPRASYETDAFASSLRKYPCPSPDRSAEIVERLINYSQSRASKSYNMKNQTRFSDSNFSSNLKTPRNSTNRTSHRWDPGIKERPRLEESPTRDRCVKPKGDSTEYEKAIYSRNYDVKCCKETPKSVRESSQIFSPPFNHSVCPLVEESYDHMPQRVRGFSKQFRNSVNMETQATVRMVSKEVSTVSRPEPSRRTIAVSLSATSSKTKTTKGERVLLENTKSTQKTSHIKRKYVQTISFTDLTSSENEFDVKNRRRTKSDEEITKTDEYFRRKVLAEFGNVSCRDETKDMNKNECVRRMLRFHTGERTRRTYNRCTEYIPISLPLCCRSVEEDTSRNIAAYNNITHLFRAEVTSLNINEDIDSSIKNWINDLPINSKHVGGEMNKQRILNNMSFKLKKIIIDRFATEILNLKSEILSLTKDIPIDANVSCNRTKYMNELVDILLDRIKTIIKYQNGEYNKRSYDVKPFVTCKLRNNAQITKENLKDFIREHLLDYFGKLNFDIREIEMHELENELTDIITNSYDFVNQQDVKHQMKYLLTGLGHLRTDQADCVIKSLLEIIWKITSSYSNSRIFTVLQNTSQNTSPINGITDSSIARLTEEDVKVNLDFYMNQLCEQIHIWLNKLNLDLTEDLGFRQVVVHDLADDIINRHKYLALNPSRKCSEEENLEQLKYQIFKSINKLVGENTTETLQNAHKLMLKIKSIPVPMLTSSKRQKVIPSNMYPHTQYPSSISNKCSSEQFNPDTNFTGKRLGISKVFIDSSRRVESLNKQKGISDGPDIISVDKKDQNPTEDISIVTRHNNYSEILNSLFITDNLQVVSDSQGIGTETEIIPKLATLQLNKNIQENKIHTSNYNLVSFRPLNPGVNVKSVEKNSFSEITFSKPALINTDLYGGNMNQQMILLQNASTSIPLAMNTSIKDGPRPMTSTKNIRDAQLSPCCKPKDPSHIALSIKQLNEEFDEYLKQWVQDIPIVVSKPEEQALAEKARIGLYNGIWKAITKLKLKPSIFHNRFYYQDLLDDEVESLLNILPKTPELESKKHALKVRLIEKTTDMNERIISLATTSFRQQLIENVENSLLTLDKTNKFTTKLHEELQKLCLAEDYILYIRYKDDDQVKANVYRKKILRNVEELIDNIKTNYGKELKDIDPVLYMNEVVSALDKVPLPSENTIREEADEILLEIEIGQWFSDLPLIENYDHRAQLQRIRLRDTLAKKIHDIENDTSLSFCEMAMQIRHNIRKFLEKIPLEEETDVNFVTDELLNRLKNRPKESATRKSVLFQEPQDYQQFKSEMDCCSTFVEPGGTAEDRNKDSITRRSVGAQEPQDYEEFSRNMPCCSSFSDQPSDGMLRDTSSKSYPIQSPSAQQWLSLNETRAPPSTLNSPQSQKPPGLNYPCTTPQFLTANQTYTGNQIRQPVPYDVSQPTQHTCGQPSCSNTNQSGFQALENKPTNQITQNSNLHQMAGGGLGIIGTSKSPRPSEMLENSKTTSTQPYSDIYKTVYKSTDREGIQETILNRSKQKKNASGIHSTPRNYNMGQTLGYTTPLPMNQGTPAQRPKKNFRQFRRPKDGVRRRLGMEDTESEEEKESSGSRCTCMERFSRIRRRRPIVYSCEGYNMTCPHFIPIRCPYAYFF